MYNTMRGSEDAKFRIFFQVVELHKLHKQLEKWYEILEYLQMYK
jgi:hypothetical protein